MRGWETGGSSSLKLSRPFSLTFFEPNQRLIIIAIMPEAAGQCRFERLVAPGEDGRFKTSRK